jgi:hypothetical protein
MRFPENDYMIKAVLMHWPFSGPTYGFLCLFRADRQPYVLREGANIV